MAQSRRRRAGPEDRAQNAPTGGRSRRDRIHPSSAGWSLDLCPRCSRDVRRSIHHKTRAAEPKIPRGIASGPAKSLLFNPIARWVFPCAIVEVHPATDAGPRLAAIRVGFQMHFFVLDRAPQPFDESVVHEAAASVHRNLDADRHKLAGESLGGESGAPNGIESPRLSKPKQRLETPVLFGDRADSAARLAPGTFGADVPSGFRRLSFGLPGALGHDGGGMKDKRKDAFGVLNGEFTGGARRGSGLQAWSDFATASQKLRTRVGFLVVCGHRTHPVGWVAGSGSQALLSFLRSPASRTARRHRRKGARTRGSLRRAGGPSMPQRAMMSSWPPSALRTIGASCSGKIADSDGRFPAGSWARRKRVRIAS